MKFKEKLKFTFLFITLSLVSLKAMSADFKKSSIKKDFESIEFRTNSNFSEDLIRELGGRALFLAKIVDLDLDSIFIQDNTSYFRLKNTQDICRQVFINETVYIVHTICFREDKILLNFIKVFPK